ncbi:MAG: HNH endonuclease [Chloroflexota bacterium]
MREQVPLVYFHGIAPGRYVAAWPVYIVGDEPDRLVFRVAFDEQSLGLDPTPVSDQGAVAEDSPIRRAYITATVRRRLHQEAFRERVLRAYTERCALCRLRHRQLLDAAHIDPDAAETGDPVVSNGIALCKLHHAAFDAFFITVRPDYRIEVRESILAEEDGPMLLHGLKALHGELIALPHDLGLRPDRERLEHRYDLFHRTG